MAIPHRVMRTKKYVRLSSHATRLLNEFALQFNGKNNGDLSATWKMMENRGFNSPSTLNKALKQLKESGFIEVTRYGGNNICNLYALTWLAIDDCKGKLDVNETRTPSGWWKD